MSAQRVQQQLMRMADPHGRVAMVAQGVAGVRVEKNIERAVIQREPADNLGELLLVNAS